VIVVMASVPLLFSCPDLRICRPLSDSNEMLGVIPLLAGV
jgi:hypothetical protein